MSPMTVPVEVSSQLAKSGSVTLNAQGVGVIILDPDNARQRWVVTSVYVSTNQAANAIVVPVATLGINTVIQGQGSPGNLRGSSWSGNMDTFSGSTDIGPCDFLSVMFGPANGQSGSSLAGVVCTTVVSGTKYTRRS